MKTLTINFPHDKNLTVQPVPRSELAAFTKHMAEIQAIWLDEGFSTGDAIARDDCWNHMTAVSKMLPKNDTPAVRGFDLDALSNDYEQMESLFFGDASQAFDAGYVSVEQALIDGFQIDLFKGCALYELHRFEPKKKLIHANRLRWEKSQNEPSPQKTSQSKGAATRKQTRSPTSSTALAQKTA